MSPFIQDFAGGSLLSYFLNDSAAPEKLETTLNKHGEILDFNSQLSLAHMLYGSYGRIGKRNCGYRSISYYATIGRSLGRTHTSNTHWYATVISGIDKGGGNLAITTPGQRYIHILMILANKLR